MTRLDRLGRAVDALCALVTGGAVAWLALIAIDLAVRCA